MTKLLSSMGYVFQSVLSFLYSDETQKQGIKVTYCKVRHDVKTDSKYFYFRMRRYIYNHHEQKFIPGCWDVTDNSTIGSWLDPNLMYHGLNYVEATERLKIVGPNVLDLRKPTIVSSIMNEFSAPFYLYQNFST